MSEGKRKTRRQRYRPSRTHASHAIDDQHQDERHHESDDRALSADHGPKHVIREIRHPVECRDWNRQRPKGDRRGVGDQGHHGRLYGIEANRHQHRAADCNGHAGTRQGLDQSAETIRDDDRLDTQIIADATEAFPKNAEVARLDRHVIDPHRVDENPGDGQDSEGDAEEAAVERGREGHGIDESRDSYRRR